MKKDEIRTSELFAKYMKYLNTFEDGKYTVYEFEDESGNLAVHYQVRPELIADKKAATLAKLFNTRMSKIKIGEICLTLCKCREIQEEGYNQSAYYLNVDRVIYPLAYTTIELKPYRGSMCEYAVEHHITEWDQIDPAKYKAPRDFI
jgi:hypothetical protein